ncbi:hypothetical protein ACH33_05425 [Aneurinibacillus sp. XH2]|uniref:hypothetical protein n=1 Tax=Aneurinibacillus sp. XH2 TaxID=1450761 RepID=UPI00070A66BD|nr:hypothetical protein [Aneurinibacillus sp. XH2]AMA72348.1 hypothetical protein ACH33_05425 [Aneurinibacillus sp. XH2]
MGEKNILAYFKSPEEAEKAASELQTLGVVDMQIDRISRFPGDGVGRIMNPITSNMSSLADVTLGADVSNRDAGVLLAADVGASGMSDGGQDDTIGRDILLTIVVEEEKHHSALQIVEKNGGIQ